jgi:hypothetical protein
MSARLANVLVLAIFIAAGLVYLWVSRQIMAGNPAAGIGPVQFPGALAALLVVLCAVEMVRTLRAAPEAERIEIPPRLVATVVLTGAFFALWSVVGRFYPLAAGFFAVLVLVYQPGRPTPRGLALAAGLAVAFAAGLWLVFGLAFGVRLD